jgi:hypothetical protein
MCLKLIQIQRYDIIPVQIPVLLTSLFPIFGGYYKSFPDWILNNKPICVAGIDITTPRMDILGDQNRATAKPSKAENQSVKAATVS